MIGLSLLVVANLMYAAGAFIADFNETHVYNPRWPPHAKFHNGQTMTLGVLLASASLYLAFRRSVTISERHHDLFMAAVIGSFYCIAGLAAILYPGTDWSDRGSELEVPDGQKYLFGAIVVMVWSGYLMERNGLKTASDKKK